MRLCLLRSAKPQRMAWTLMGSKQRWGGAGKCSAAPALCACSPKTSIATLHAECGMLMQGIEFDEERAAFEEQQGAPKNAAGRWASCLRVVDPTTLQTSG